jgi:hypothetical protein
LQALAAGQFRPDMEITTDEFSGTFAKLQRWERTRRRVNLDTGTGRGRGGADD